MGLNRIPGMSDPLVRLLAVAIALATILPVSAQYRPIAQAVSDAAIFCLFLLNGLRLPRHEVLRGIGNYRFLLPLVVWCYGAMALLGFGAFHLLDGRIEATLALGFLYLGTLPSTVQSATAYSSLAGGNVASSVVAAALLNILGVFVTAPLFSLLAGSGNVAFDLAALEKIAVILLLPFAIGQLLQSRFGATVRENRRLVSWMDRSAIALAVYVAFSGAVEQGLWNKLGPSDWAVTVATVMLFLLLAFGGAWLLGGALRLNRGDRIAMLFSGAQKSIAMGAPLAMVLFSPSTAGIILVPVLIYHLLQLVVSAPLAARLSRG